MMVAVGHVIQLGRIWRISGEHLGGMKGIWETPGKPDGALKETVRIILFHQQK